MSGIDPWLVLLWLAASYFAALVFLRAMTVTVQKRIEAIDVAREAVHMRLTYDELINRRAEHEGDDDEPIEVEAH